MESRLDIQSVLSSPRDVKIFTAEEVILPDEVIFSYGDESYGIETERSFYTLEKISSDLNSLTDVSGAEMTEIGKDEYDTIKSLTSVSVRYAYGLPLLETFRKYDITRIVGLDSSVSVDEITFVKAFPDSVFMQDGSSGRFYRFKSKLENPVAEGLHRNRSAHVPPSYYRTSTIFGGDNQVLLPVKYYSFVDEIPYEDESFVNAWSGFSKDEDMAEALFGENFDFVRRIKDSFGNVTYMYSYGQKTFSVSADGMLEYKTEPSAGASKGFYGDLELALSFMGRHDSEPLRWNGSVEDCVLMGYSRIKEERRDGHVFHFGFREEELDVFFPEGRVITVEVINGSVTYYRRDQLFLVTRITEPDEEMEAVDAINMIAKEYPYIYENIIEIDSVVSEDIMFNTTVKSIKGFRAGFLKVPERWQLVPVWAVEVSGGKTFFFELYDGDALGIQERNGG